MFKFLLSTSLVIFVIAILLSSVGCQTSNSGGGSYGGSDGHFGHNH